MYASVETVRLDQPSFRQVHWWLAAALAVTLYGFSFGYFFRLSEATWFQHLHGLSATAWMTLLVLQPWLATRGRLNLHRTIGPLALILGGMVIASAAATLPFNIHGAMNDPSPIAPATFLYGVTLFDLVAITGFAIALVMAMLKVKHRDGHALWMLSTVFWVLMPGVARAAAFTIFLTAGPGQWSLIDVAFWVTLALMGALVGLMTYLRRAHPALILTLIGNALGLIITPVGNNPAWRSFCEAVFLPLTR